MAETHGRGASQSGWELNYILSLPSPPALHRALHPYPEPELAAQAQRCGGAPLRGGLQAREVGHEALEECRRDRACVQAQPLQAWQTRHQVHHLPAAHTFRVIPPQQLAACYHAPTRSACSRFTYTRYTGTG